MLLVRDPHEPPRTARTAVSALLRKLGSAPVEKVTANANSASAADVDADQ